MVTINLKNITAEDFEKIKEGLEGCETYVMNDIVLCEASDTHPYSITFGMPEDIENTDSYKCVDVDVLVEMCTLVEPDKC